MSWILVRDGAPTMKRFKKRVTRGEKDWGEKKRDPETVSLDERKIPEGQKGERENRNEN